MASSASKRSTSRRQSLSGVSSTSSLSSVVSIDTTCLSTEYEGSTSMSSASSLGSVVSADTTRSTISSNESIRRALGDRKVKRKKTYYELAGILREVKKQAGRDSIHYWNGYGEYSYQEPGKWPEPGRKVYWKGGRLIGEDVVEAKRASRKARILAEDTVSEVGTSEFCESPASHAGTKSWHHKFSKIAKILGTAAFPEVMIDHANSSRYSALILVEGETPFIGMEVWANLDNRYLYSYKSLSKRKTAERAAMKAAKAGTAVDNPRCPAGYYMVGVHRHGIFSCPCAERT